MAVARKLAALLGRASGRTVWPLHKGEKIIQGETIRDRRYQPLQQLREAGPDGQARDMSELHPIKKVCV